MKEQEKTLKPKLFEYLVPGADWSRGSICEYYDENGNQVHVFHNPYSTDEWSEIIVISERPQKKDKSNQF